MKNASTKRFRCRFFAITESNEKEKRNNEEKSRSNFYRPRAHAGVNSLSPLKSTDTGNSRRDPRGSRTQVFYRERGILNEREFIEKIRGETRPEQCHPRHGSTNAPSPQHWNISSVVTPSSSCLFLPSLSDPLSLAYLSTYLFPPYGVSLFPYFPVHSPVTA